jgi:hypothetical protein
VTWCFSLDLVKLDALVVVSLRLWRLREDRSSATLHPLEGPVSRYRWVQSAGPGAWISTVDAEGLVIGKARRTFSPGKVRIEA